MVDNNGDRLALIKKKLAKRMVKTAIDKKPKAGVVGILKGTTGAPEAEGIVPAKGPNVANEIEKAFKAAIQEKKEEEEPGPKEATPGTMEDGEVTSILSEERGDELLAEEKRQSIPGALKEEKPNEEPSDADEEITKEIMLPKEVLPPVEVKPPVKKPVSMLALFAEGAEKKTEAEQIEDAKKARKKIGTHLPAPPTESGGEKPEIEETGDVEEAGAYEPPGEESAEEEYDGDVEEVSDEEQTLPRFNFNEDDWKDERDLVPVADKEGVITDFEKDVIWDDTTTTFEKELTEEEKTQIHKKSQDLKEKAGSMTPEQMYSELLQGQLINAQTLAKLKKTVEELVEKFNEGMDIEELKDIIGGNTGTKKNATPPELPDFDLLKLAPKEMKVEKDVVNVMLKDNCYEMVEILEGTHGEDALGECFNRILENGGEGIQKRHELTDEQVKTVVERVRKLEEGDG